MRPRLRRLINGPASRLPASEDRPAAHPRTWTTVAEFSSSGGMHCDRDNLRRGPSFTIPKDTPARLRFRFSGSRHHGLWLHYGPAPYNRDLLVNSVGPTEGEIDLNHTGEMHLDVESDAEWTVTVQAYLPVDTETRPGARQPVVRHVSACHFVQAEQAERDPRLTRHEMIPVLAFLAMIATLVIWTTVTLAPTVLGVITTVVGVSAISAQVLWAAYRSSRPVVVVVEDTHEIVAAWRDRLHGIGAPQDADSYFALATSDGNQPAVTLLRGRLIASTGVLRADEIYRMVLPADATVREIAEAGAVVDAEAERREQAAILEHEQRKLGDDRLFGHRRQLHQDLACVQRALNR